jgi:two-component system response regulator MprA
MNAPHRPLVLLVDDEARSARMLAQMLREDGYEVELAVDGPGALARLSRDPAPDALVTDVNLATVDGLTVARYARSRRPSLPVLVVTGYPELVRTSNLDGGPPMVFTKPVDYRQLALALGESVRADQGKRLTRSIDERG